MILSGPWSRMQSIIASQIVSEATSTRPSLALLQRAETRANEALAQSSSTWIPRFSITAGPRIGSNETTRYGYVAGISLDVPVFSIGQDIQALAQAQQEQALARADAAERAIDIHKLVLHRL